MRRSLNIAGPGGVDSLTGLEDDFDEEDEFEFLEEEREFDDEEALEIDFVRIDEIKKKK